MAGKQRILNSSGDFIRVMRTGRRLAGKTVAVRWAANDLGLSRLGMNVGKRILSRAVDRNRTKRRLREAFRAGGRCLGGIDVVVSLRAGAGREAAAGREFASLLARIAGGGRK